MPTLGASPRDWACPQCKRNVPRDNRAETPVKGCDGGADADAELEEAATADAAVVLEEDQGCSGFDLGAELRLLRQEMVSGRNEMRVELAGIKSELRDFRSEFTEVKRMVEGVDQRVLALEERVDTMERAFAKRAEVLGTKVLEDAIAELQCQLADRDQEMFGNDVQVSGIPETPAEHVLHLVQLVGTKMGVQIDERDVVTAARMGARREGDQPRPLVIRLARRATRDDLLAAARVRRGATTADLELPGPPRRFYVNERLTRLNRQLLGKARERARETGWKYVWTRDGRVRARRADGEPQHQIRTEADIDRVFRKDHS